MRDNAFGLNGTDLNGRELAYDGNGSDNCFGGNTGVTVTIPADGSTLAACPFAGANAFSGAIQLEMLEPGRRGERRAVDQAPARAEARLQAAGAVQEVIGRRTLPLAAAVALLGATPAVAAAPKPKSVQVADNYYLPAKLTVKPDARHVEVAGRQAIDVHDVKLKSAPQGVKKWQSEPASSGYRFKRTLTKAGTYKIICTLHEEMKMTITVKK